MSMATLEKALKVCNDNQSELARRMHTSRQLIRLWLDRKRVPSWRMDALTVIAKDGRK